MSYIPFYEVAELLAVLPPASQTTEQQSGYVDMAKYERIFAILSVGAMTTNATLDVDVEITTDGEAAGLHTLKSITQLTEAGGDGDQEIIIEIRAEELSKPSGAPSQEYQYVNIEVTPAVAAVILGLHVFGYAPRYAPVPTTLWQEIVG
jgi:hypothetical protein